MKIVITAAAGDLAAPFDPRFGRGANFVFFDTETGLWEAYPNPALQTRGGAGIQAAKFIAGHGARVVISGDFGPHAHQALTAAHIEMFLAPTDEALTVQEVITRYQQGALEPAPASSDTRSSSRSGRRRS